MKLPAEPDADDAALVARCRQGDERAWTALVQRYQRLVYAIVRRFGDDEHAAADVFQTVFSRLLQHLPRIEDPSRLQAWVVTTAKREALLQRQRARRQLSLDAPADGGAAADGDGQADAAPGWDLPDEGPGPEDQLSQLQRWHQLRLALDRLDGRCSTLLTLLFADEDERVPYDEVARRLAIPVGSIGPTRGRCLDKLRRLLAQGHVD